VNLFQKLQKSNFDEIQKISNVKEKMYIEIIAQLRADYELLKAKSVEEINKLKNELSKYRKQN
jgi:hypothetical protein